MHVNLRFLVKFNKRIFKGLIFKSKTFLMLVYSLILLSITFFKLINLYSLRRYSQVAASMSHRYKDQMTTPTDRAVYWTEYVIRHKGAQHLRSPEADLSWIELLGLDILAMIHLVIFIVYKLLSKLFGLCFGKKKSQKGKNKKE